MSGPTPLELLLLVRRTVTKTLDPPRVRIGARCYGRAPLPRKYASLATSSASNDAPPPLTQLSADAVSIPESHLNPSPSSFSITPFTDRCTVSLSSGAGGHGCVSFLREKYVPEGPANGGDGGTGGSIYIEATRGESSLHKISRRPIIKAGRGENGKGKSQGGQRGDDILISVPVGTVIREIDRHDPVEEERRARLERRARKTQSEPEESESYDAARAKFIVFPGPLSGRDIDGAQDGPPALPRAHYARPGLVTPRAPILLDLNMPTPKPILLAAGGMGGLGNPHFITKETVRPKYATKGEKGVQMSLHLELKVLADVGLVGLPNAGKSTLLRALTRSRTRVGNWAFTTLQPSIGTVVLDDHTGRPSLPAFVQGSGERGEVSERRTQFTIADIPGLIEDAHLDKGLGLGFLRHVERAMCLCFVIDLSRDDLDAVHGLKALWREVSEYEIMRAREVSAETERRTGSTIRFEAMKRVEDVAEGITPLPPMSSKPWFVVATKADLPGTKENFQKLKNYIDMVNRGKVEHPSGISNAWRKEVKAIPISAIKAEGVQAIPRTVVDLLR